jgi:hypothetical protein
MRERLMEEDAPHTAKGGKHKRLDDEEELPLDTD